MVVTFRVNIISNDLAQIAGRMEPKAGDVVRTTLDAIAADWKSRVHDDPGIDLPDRDYPESIHVEMETDLSGAALSTVEHSVYVELGTWKMAARPAATPAGEAARAGFESAMSKIVE